MQEVILAEVGAIQKNCPISDYWFASSSSPIQLSDSVAKKSKSDYPILIKVFKSDSIFLKAIQCF